jgi:hypothetical protein
MVSSLFVVLTLAGAPLSFEEGEFLGFTEDGSSSAWTDTVDNRAVSPPKRLTTARVRHLVQATEDTVEFEVRPFGDAKAVPTPGADVAKWEAWKKPHPLAKPTAAEQLAKALGGKAVKRTLDRRLSDLQVTFDAKPVR